MTTLQAGEYILPDGYTAVRTGNVLTIRPKKKSHNLATMHCRECKFLGRGRTQKRWIHETSCCTKRVKAEGIYYVAYPTDRACYQFEQK